MGMDQVEKTMALAEGDRGPALFVAPAPEVWTAMHVAIPASDSTVQGRNFVSGMRRIGTEPRGQAGMNDGVFYPEPLVPRGISPAPVPIRRRPTTGTARCLVLLVDFPDNEGTRGRDELRELLFSKGTHLSGSMRDFYLEASYGQLDLEGEVLGWLHMPQPYAAYVDGRSGGGAYPKNAQKLAEDALEQARGLVDLARFDADGDGYLDGLFIVHAGGGAEIEVEPAARAGKIWSHQWTMSAPVPVAGITAYAYCATPEDGKVGVFAHEFGHMLGLPDLYDTSGRSIGVGRWCLMGSGSWNDGGRAPSQLCAWAKARLGWITPHVIGGPRALRIPSSLRDVQAIYRLWDGGAQGSEYYLIEARSREGFDRALPGSGLLVWRVDETRHDNDQVGAYLVGLEQADGRHHLETGINDGDAGDPFPGSAGVTRFDAALRPRFGQQGSGPAGVVLDAIQEAGGAISAQASV